ncbi:MAG: type II toxin-antitoxin system HicB family antitoxin [Candidatus Binataceae bacterium]
MRNSAQKTVRKPDSTERAGSIRFTAVFRKVPEGYIAFAEEIPGANSQEPTLAKARRSLKEAVVLVLEANRAMAEEAIRGASVIRETIELEAR